MPSAKAFAGSSALGFPVTLPDGQVVYAIATVPVDPTSGTVAALPAGTDRSGVTVVGAIDVAPANSARMGLTIQNTSDTAMRVTENGATATATTGYLLPVGGLFKTSTTRRISLYCATADKTFAATEF